MQERIDYLDVIYLALIVQIQNAKIKQEFSDTVFNASREHLQGEVVVFAGV